MTEDSVRKLGFGGIVGAALGAALVFFLPQLFVGVITPSLIISAGIAIGAAFSRGIETVLKFILPGTVNFITFYSKLLEATGLRIFGVITPERHRQAVDGLVDWRFQDYAGKPKLLPENVNGPASTSVLTER
jgi:hypothetical protein